MRILIYSLLLGLALPAYANQESSASAQPKPAQPTPAQSAQQWLSRLAAALGQVNFSTSFVVVKNNYAEPYHWLHGVTDAGDELEIISLLNGPRRDILRVNNIVSYIEPEFQPYSIKKARISGPIPRFIFQPHQELTEHYNIVSVGKSRVLGRLAQLIRIEAKDQQRFGYWLWLDQHSGLLLKLALIDEVGSVLEQIQFTHLEISDAVAPGLLQLQQNDLPQVIDSQAEPVPEVMAWRLAWLPKGFKRIEANKHSMLLTKQPVEFMLFNDGVVDLSVYINHSDVQQRDMSFVKDGATTALNQVVGGYEVSVVGKVPVAMAKKVADSVILVAPNK